MQPARAARRVDDEQGGPSVQRRRVNRPSRVIRCRADAARSVDEDDLTGPARLRPPRCASEFWATWLRRELGSDEPVEKGRFADVVRPVGRRAESCRGRLGRRVAQRPARRAGRVDPTHPALARGATAADLDARAWISRVSPEWGTRRSSRTTSTPRCRSHDRRTRVKSFQLPTCRSVVNTEQSVRGISSSLVGRRGFDDDSSSRSRRDETAVPQYSSTTIAIWSSANSTRSRPPSASRARRTPAQVACGRGPSSPPPPGRSRSSGQHPTRGRRARNTAARVPSSGRRRAPERRGSRQREVRFAES